MPFLLPLPLNLLRTLAILTWSCGQSAQIDLDPLLGVNLIEFSILSPQQALPLQSAQHDDSDCEHGLGHGGHDASDRDYISRRGQTLS